MPGPPGPVRTCIGCRKRAPATSLLRVVAQAGVAQPDPGHRLSGRGAHLHRDAHCLDLAERRRALPRALRVPGPLDLTALRAEIHQNPVIMKDLTGSSRSDPS